MDEVDLWSLKEAIEREVERARMQGYFPLDVGDALKKATGLLIKYRGTKSWERGYWGRAQNYDLGFDVEREGLLLQAREALLRAKGAVIALKLPTWAKELRYYYTDVQWGAEAAGSLDPRRGVVFMSGREWALKGFPETQEGLWYRCNCRPTVDGVRMIEGFHGEGKRVGTYLSGGMMAVTYALLPDSEEDWTDDFMREYAGHYWHGKMERYWGARGPSSDWQDRLIPDMSFSRWMMRQLEFAQRVGFDFIHLDEAFGRYPDAHMLSERNPNFVVCPNNLARMYVDEEGWRFGWTAMGESLGQPSRWDEFYSRMRRRSLEARNITWWGWHAYTPFEEAYQNLSYATTLANKGTDVSHSNPSDEYIEFSRRLSDYIYSPYVDVYVSQDVVKSVEAPEHLRTIVNRRVLASGKEELIIHLLNTKPDVQSIKQVMLEVDLSGFKVKWPPTITFAAPKFDAKVLEVEVEDRRIRFETPEITVWGIIVIGESLYPRVELRFKSRSNVPVSHPLDYGFVPGEEIEVEAKVDEIVTAEYSMDLHLPEGWEYREVNVNDVENLRLFKVIPLFADKDKGYAVTPILRQFGEAMPSWPVILQAKDKICFKLIPPMAESPDIRADYGLEVKNYSKAGAVKFTLKPPEGWKMGRTEFEMDMEAGETRSETISMVSPDYHIRFWDQLDVDIPIDWTFQGFKGSSNLRVRVFPTRFHVHSRGVDTMIMHSYPNLYFIDDLEEAKSSLKRGEYVTLWLVNQDPEKHGPVVDEFVSMGGGVVWMGQPFLGENCPVTLDEMGLESKTIRYLMFPNEPEDRLLTPAKRKRTVYESEKGFKTFRVKVKDWGKALAVWGKPSEGAAIGIEGTPALVVSKDPNRRVVYIGSDLEVESEEAYRFEDRNHHESHWYQTYIFYSLLNWASGAYNL